MRTIHIDASIQYDVLIGENLLVQTGERIKELGNVRHVVVVSDDRVFPIYGESVLQSLRDAGIQAESFVFPHGEASKCMAVYEELLEFLCDCHLTRSDVLAALGGGVTGDLTGFAAATYQRGIRFVQIPTSLLAAVDSSVGGKTAVNLKGGKNQVGCFYQPSLVLCDTDTLKTLPEEEFRGGCAEVIKYAVLGDRDFFDRLKEEPAHLWTEEVIARCVSMKRDIVMQDEYDLGLRMLLNFGHTLGHGVEKCSHFKVSHGYAVAMGMAAITRSAQARGICPAGTAEELTEVLKEYGLPTELPFPANALAEASRADKKSTGKTLRLVLPRKIGECFIETIPQEELIDWILSGPDTGNGGFHERA